MRIIAGLILATTLSLPHVATAQSDACTEIAGIFDEAIEEWPDLLSTARVKPRMAAVKIATSAGIALNYANDANWSDENKAPVIALRDTRELDPADPNFSKEKTPALLHGYLIEISEVLSEICPDTAVPDIIDLSLDYPDN